MDWRDYITMDPEVRHGRARIAGTRVLVTSLLDNLASGSDAETMTKSYPSLTMASVQAAMAYAAKRAETLPSGCGRRG